MSISFSVISGKLFRNRKDGNYKSGIWVLKGNLNSLIKLEKIRNKSEISKTEKLEGKEIKMGKKKPPNQRLDGS